jgi:hypothetical protein
MSYQRIQTPKIYCDNINWLMTSGKMDSSDLTQSGITSVSPIEMFDMKPSNLITIGGNGVSTTHYININTTITTDSNQDMNFVAIMGHNFKQAGLKFKIQTDDNSGFGSPKTPTMTPVVNCNLDVTNTYCEPDENGWSLLTFTQASDNQYIRVVIEPRYVETPYATDIKIGSIMVGEHYEFPHSPDMGIKKSIDYDGVKKQQSIGGQIYANASYLSGADWFLDPMRISTETNPNALRKTGRVNLDISFSYLADTNIFSAELFDKTHFIGTNNLMSNLIFRTHGGMLPMLFQYDKDATNGEDSFLWCRLNDTPSFTQVANRVWDTSIKLIEEY